MAGLPPLGAPLPPDDLGGLPPEAMMGLPPEAAGLPLPPPVPGPVPGAEAPGDDLGMLLIELVNALSMEQQAEQDLLLDELLTSLGIPGAGPDPLAAGLSGAPVEAVGLPPADLGAGPVPEAPAVGGPAPEDILF